MKILVAGGAGYIGSHTVKALAREGYEPLVFDDFSSGRRDFVRGRETVVGDLMCPGQIRDVFRSYPIGAVLHFASLIQVGESYRDPGKYYRRNLATAVNLLDACRDAGVEVFIFSSSAAVYGQPVKTPIPEDHPTEPISPYGTTKLMIEKILADYGRAYGLRSISLRYFNAAGADPDGELGEAHDPETHLVPNVLLSLLGRIPGIDVFGTDFPTPDGTAVRDYIHVADLAEAHLLGLRALLGGAGSEVMNLGTNRGYSVLEVIRKAEEITGRKAEWKAAPRRAGDPAVLLASKDLAERVLGWRPRFSDLETILRTAWDWHRK